MKLNGKDKKKSRYTVNMKYRTSNAKGYKIYIDTHGADPSDFEYPDGVDYYLKTPKGKIFLEHTDTLPIG